METSNYRNKIVIVALLFASLLCGMCINDGSMLSASNATNKIMDEKGMSVDDFKKRISNSNKVVLVYFHANWCIPCVKLKPEIAEIETEVNTYCEVVKIDTDENPLIADYYEINGLPMFVIYKNGVKSWENIGALSKTQILEKINLYKIK
jgi:thioredoxin 1